MHSLQIGLWVVVLLVALALLFDFMNGFHDAANSIATVVSTGVLKPHQAVAFAAFFNVLALTVFHLKVATTVGKGTLDPAIVDHYVVFGALVGAGLVKGGPGVLIWSGLGKTLVFILLSPLLGFLLGSLIMVIVSRLFFHSTPQKVDRWFRRLQLVSASLYSLGHGGNDAQKTMGIIWMLLIATGYANSDGSIPTWVILSCYLAMGLGTLFGGWRIVRTMGQKITKLKPVGGFCAETGGAVTLFLAATLGVPVSTTHTITGAIVGVGSTSGVRNVRWGVAGSIVWAWVLTIPCSALMAAIAWYIGRAIL